jgi:hypothetical protein
MATWPAGSVPTFPAGWAPQASDMNTWWYNTAGFLQNGVVLRVHQAGTATTLPDTGAVTTIAFNNVDEDPYSGWNPATHLWTPPAGYSGWFQATLTIRTAGLAGLVDLKPLLVGTYSYQLSTLQSAQAGASGTNTVYLVGGQDTIGGACSLLNSGSNANTSITAGQQSTLEIVWVSQS